MLLFPRDSLGCGFIGDWPEDSVAEWGNVSKLAWNSFDHALRRYGGNDPCELAARSVE